MLALFAESVPLVAGVVLVATSAVGADGGAVAADGSSSAHATVNAIAKARTAARIPWTKVTQRRVLFLVRTAAGCLEAIAPCCLSKRKSLFLQRVALSRTFCKQTTSSRLTAHS